MGLSKERCMHEYWPLQRSIPDTWQCAVWHVVSMGICLGKDFTTIAECILTFNRGKFFSLCSTGDAEYVQNSQITLRGGQHLGGAQATRQRGAYQSRYRYSDGQREPHTEDRWDVSPRQVPHQGADPIGTKPKPTCQQS